MNPILTSLVRSSALRRTPFILRTSNGTRVLQPSMISRSLLQRPALLQARFAASSVSGRPGSQSVEHAARNVKEEVGNSAADWAKAIAGGNFTQDSVTTDTDPTFVCFSNLAFLY